MPSPKTVNAQLYSRRDPTTDPSRLVPILPKLKAGDNAVFLKNKSLYEAVCQQDLYQGGRSYLRCVGYKSTIVALSGATTRLGSKTLAISNAVIVVESVAQ